MKTHPINTTSVNKQSSVEALLAINPENIGSEALKTAAEKFRKQQEAEESDRAFQVFSKAQQNLVSEVDKLRKVRKLEKTLLENVEVLDGALKAFQQNGDVKAYNEAVAKVVVINYVDGTSRYRY